MFLDESGKIKLLTNNCIINTALNETADSKFGLGIYRQPCPLMFIFFNESMTNELATMIEY